MSDPVIGVGAYLGFAEETTYGTAVTPATAWLGRGLRSCTLGQRRVRQVVGTIGTTLSGQVHHNAHRSIETEINVDGVIEWVPHYAGYGTGILLKHALGKVTSTGCDPYDHEYTQDYDAVTGLTIQLDRGQHGTLNHVEAFEGCRIEVLEIIAQARQPLVMRAGFIGETSGGLTTISGTPNFDSEDEEIQSDHGGTLSWNSDTHRFVNWTIRFERNLRRRPYVGSKLTDCPAPDGLARVTFEGTVEWVANDLYEDFRAQTQADGQLVFTGGGDSPGDNSMTIDLHNLIFDKCDFPVDGPGIRTFQVSGMAFAGTSAAETGLEITMSNNNSGAIA